MHHSISKMRHDSNSLILLIISIIIFHAPFLLYPDRSHETAKALNFVKLIDTPTFCHKQKLTLNSPTPNDDE